MRRAPPEHGLAKSAKGPGEIPRPEIDKAHAKPNPVLAHRGSVKEDKEHREQQSGRYQSKDRNPEPSALRIGPVKNPRGPKSQREGKDQGHEGLSHD